MTFLISGCIQATDLILVSILTFSRSGISNMLKKITWPWRLTLELKVTHINCMTYLISGCIQATDLILVLILTLLRSGISSKLKKITWPWRLTLELKVTHMNCMTFLISGCIQATDLILVSILTFARSRISENLKSVTWPWWLTLKMKVKHIWVWLFVSLVVNIIQTRSLYRF